MSIFFPPACCRTLSETAHSRFRCGDPKLCLPRFSRMLLLALFQISNVYFTCGSALQCLGGYFKPCQFTFPSLFLFSRALSYAAQSNFWCRDLKLCSLGFVRMLVWPSFKFTHVYFLLVGVFRFGRCLGKRFLPISTFFSLVSPRAFRDVPHSCLRCGDPNQYLPNFLKMLLLALPQI